MKKLDTMTIQTENGPVVINASDFDEEIHTLAAAEAADKAAAEAADKAAAEAADKAAARSQMLVSKEGRKWFVVSEQGDRIEDIEGINKSGYSSEAKAWADIVALK